MTQGATRQERLRGKRTMLAQLLALAGVIGPIFFVLGFTIAGWLDPGYSPLQESVSALGAEGPYPWLQNATFVVFGLLLLAFALGFFHQMREVLSTKGRRASTFLLVLTGTGLVSDGFLTEGPVTTLHGVLHGLGFLIIFGSLIIALLLIGGQLRAIAAWRGAGWYTMMTGMLTLGVLILSAALADPLQLTGLFQRILVVIAFGWYVVMGSRLVVYARAQERRAGRNASPGALEPDQLQ